MNSEPEQAIDKSRSARSFLSYALRYWTGPEKASAWFWTAAALALVLANLAVNVGINRWNKWFFDALENKEGSKLLPLVLAIIALVAVGAGFAVLMVRCRMM